MDLLEVPVQSLDEGSLVVTVGALPGLVVAVVSVHVVHQPPEAPALPLAQFTHAELFVVLRNLPLGVVTQRLPLDQLLWRDDLLGSSPLPLEHGVEGDVAGDACLHVGLLDDLHVLVRVARVSAPPATGVRPVRVKI